MEEPVLGYASGAVRSTWTNATVVVLWLWAILDVAGGLIILLAALLMGMFAGPIIGGGSIAGPCLILASALAGALILAWGILTGGWAAHLHRRESNAAQSACDAVRMAQRVWLAGYAIIPATLAIALFSEGNTQDALLPITLVWTIFYVTIHAAIGSTILIAKKAVEERLVAESLTSGPHGTLE